MQANKQQLSRCGPISRGGAMHHYITRSLLERPLLMIAAKHRAETISTIDYGHQAQTADFYTMGKLLREKRYNLGNENKDIQEIMKQL